jgi:arylsulfatase A-like enzyme
MQANNSLTRRDFLKVAGTSAAGVTLLGAAAASAGCSSIREGKKMNIMVVIIDSLRKDHIGAYGNDWIETPNLDALAKESLRFTRAHPESLPTIPARRAIHTGIRTFPFREREHQKGLRFQPYGWQRIPEEQTTLTETLEPERYNTMLVTDTYLQWLPSMNFHRGFGLYHWIRGQERDFYQPISLAPREKLKEALVKGSELGKLRHHFANTAGRKSEEDWFAPQVFLQASNLLEEMGRGEQPFFFVVDCFDPHEPWDPPENYISLYDDGYSGPEPLVPIYGSSDYLTERQLKRMRARYAGEVTMMDRWLGRLLEKIEELNLFENTLLMLLADHGHALGEHGYVGKPFNALYPELTDVPLFIRHPEGKGAGQTSDFYASTHDVAPTVLSVLGIEPRQPMDGQDLSVLLEGNEPEERRPHFTLGYNHYSSVRDDRYALIVRNDGEEAKLYDLSTDPEQNKNVAGKNPDVVKRMYGYIVKDAGGKPPPIYGKDARGETNEV